MNTSPRGANTSSTTRDPRYRSDRTATTARPAADTRSHLTQRPDRWIRDKSCFLRMFGAQAAGAYSVSASAPATTSRISWVISAWRARFIASVSVSISSPAALEALRMAVMRAPCSEAADSSSAR